MGFIFSKSYSLVYFLGLEAIYKNKSNYIFCKYQICNLNMQNACKRRSFKMDKKEDKGKYLEILKM